MLWAFAPSTVHQPRNDVAVVSCTSLTMPDELQLQVWPTVNGVVHVAFAISVELKSLPRLGQVEPLSFVSCQLVSPVEIV